MSHLSSFLDIASAEDPWLRRAGPAAKGKHAAHRPLPPPRRPPSPAPLPPNKLKLLVEEILYAQQLEEEFALLVLQRQHQEEDKELLKLQNELQAEDVEWEEQFASLGTKQRAERLQNRTFDCGICLEAMPIGVAVGVEGCDHELCEECMKEYVTTKIQERKYPITCPLCRAGEGEEGEAEGVMVEELVLSLGLSEELILIYDELQLLPFAVQVECRRCKQKTYIDREEHDAAKALTCPLPGCCFVWCKACQQEINPNSPVAHSCDGTNELEALVVNLRWRRCPRCRIPAEKISGCNSVYCAAPGCGTSFCYECGRQAAPHTCH